MTVSANDQITQQTTQRAVFFFICHTEKTNFTTTYSHTCKRAGEHNITFTPSEIEDNGLGLVVVGGLKQHLPSSLGFKDAEEPQWIDHTTQKKTILHDCFIGLDTVNMNPLKLSASLLS